MTLSLIYGADATGKSLHCKSFCETSDSALYISLEAKNRKLLQDVPFDVIEALEIEKAPSYKTDSIASYDKFGEIIESVLNGKSPLDAKPKVYDTIVIDGISDIPRWAEKVVLKEIQKKHPDQKVIGKDNLAGWSARNNLSHMPLERLATWAVETNSSVYMTSLITDDYVGEKKVGLVVDAKLRLRKLADVRVWLTADGRGYLAKFEKVPNWANDGESSVKVVKGGLVAEFGKRGLLQ
jgi:hypothetical protein